MKKLPSLPSSSQALVPRCPPAESCPTPPATRAGRSASEGAEAAHLPKRRKHPGPTHGTFPAQGRARQNKTVELARARHNLINSTLKSAAASASYSTGCIEDDEERGLRIDRYADNLTEAAAADETALAEDTGILNPSDENPALAAAAKAARRQAERPQWASTREARLIHTALAIPAQSIPSHTAYLDQLGLSAQELRVVVKKQLRLGNPLAITAWNRLADAYLAEGDVEGTFGSHMVGLQMCREARRFDLAVPIGEYLLRMTKHHPENHAAMHLEVAQDKLDAGGPLLQSVRLNLQQAAASARPAVQCHTLAEIGRLHVMEGEYLQGASLMSAALKRSFEHQVPAHPRMVIWTNSVGKPLLDENLGPEGRAAAFALAGNGDDDLKRWQPVPVVLLGSNA